MLFCNIAYVAQKGGFTEGHRVPFWNEEAAVAELAKGYFHDKYLTINDLFEIKELEQNRLKAGKVGPKHEMEEKFSIWHFRGGKSEKAHHSAYGGYAAEVSNYFPQDPQWWTS